MHPDSRSNLPADHSVPATGNPHSVRRIAAIDILRGLVIALMTLDHTRDFFAITAFNPTDLAHTTPLWFWTRWITHLCAPTFIFLAGVSAYLRAQKTTHKAMSGYLLSRGIVLILLEISWINFFWHFSVESIMLQVIWVLGISMIVLAGLIHLPRSLIALIAGGLILPHNLLDGIHSSSNILWILWHQGGWIPLGENFGLFVLYPLMPWIGLMAAGFVMGPVMLRPTAERQRILWRVALLLLLVFVALRINNLYGDPDPWSVQDAGWMYSLMSFVRVHKYPPSLLYLCLMLGISLFLLLMIDKISAYTSRVLSVLYLFGRHSLAFYAIHGFLIHGLAWLTMELLYGQQFIFKHGKEIFPPNYQPSLVLCYSAWLIILGIMYGCISAWEKYQYRRRNIRQDTKPA